MDRIRQADGHPIRISKGDVNEAFAAIRRKKVKDHYGACVGSLFLMWHVCPTVLLEFLAELIADTSWISSLCVRGRVFGKECPTTPVDKTRAILPLPALLQLIDALLPRLVGTHFARILPQVPECFVGARPRTQVLDITHGIQSVIEKGLDDFGSAACAQCDIQQFYDSLPLVRIFGWLVAQGTLNRALDLPEASKTDTGKVELIADLPSLSQQTCTWGLRCSCGLYPEHITGGLQHVSPRRHILASSSSLVWP